VSFDNQRKECNQGGRCLAISQLKGVTYKGQFWKALVKGAPENLSSGRNLSREIYRVIVRKLRKRGGKNWRRTQGEYVKQSTKCPNRGT